MKILFILDQFLPESAGGAAVVAFGLAKGLVKSGHELLVLTATFNPENVGDIEIESVKIKKILSYPFGKFRNFKNLKNRAILKEAKKIFKEYHPDVIHIHTLHHQFSYGIIGLAKQFSKAVFFTLHDAQTIYNGKLFPKNDYRVTWLDNFKKDGLSYNPFQKFFIRRALKKVDKIFAVSDALKKALEANGIDNIETIHNGIDAQEWTVNDFQENNILFIGRVDEAKGAEVLIKNFDIINNRITDAKLIIVGDENFSPFVRSSKGGKTGQNKNIEILPWQSNRDEIKKIFTKAAVVVTPSLYLDPFPTVNLEAMAAGRPVVGTCFGGTPEIVIDNETGYIVNPYSEKELAEKIIDLLKNKEKAITFGKAGRKRVEEMFGLELQVEKTLAQYENIIKKIN